MECLEIEARIPRLFLKKPTYNLMGMLRLNTMGCGDLSEKTISSPPMKTKHIIISTLIN